MDEDDDSNPIPYLAICKHVAEHSEITLNSNRLEPLRYLQCTGIPIRKIVLLQLDETHHHHSVVCMGNKTLASMTEDYRQK